MLTVKFKKINNAVYMSHIDMQTVINRTIKRAGLRPEYSQGFNPHALLKLSVPIPLGYASVAEYFTLEIKDVSAQEFLEKTKNTAPQGIEFIEAWDTAVKPNLTGKTIGATYKIDYKNIASIEEKLNDIIENKQFFIEKKTKKDVEIKEVSELIYGLNYTENTLFVTLAAGEKTLRIDKFIEFINKNFELEISSVDALKIAQIIDDGNKISADEYMKKLTL